MTPNCKKQTLNLRGDNDLTRLKEKTLTGSRRYSDLLNTLHPLLDVLLQDAFYNLPAGCDINAQAATTMLIICEIYESVEPTQMPCTLFTSLGTRPTIQLIVDLIFSSKKRFDLIT